MSVRRADHKDLAHAPALPPTLFRLPDLNRDPSCATDPASPKSDSESVPSASLESNEAGNLGHAPAAAIAADTVQTNRNAGAVDHAPHHSGAHISSTPETKADSSPEPQRPLSIDESDQPAGRSWMQAAASNRGIAVMLVLVFIAAWWTSPKFSSEQNEYSATDAFAQADGNGISALGSDEAITAADLDFDLGDEFPANEKAIPANDQAVAMNSDSYPTDEPTHGLNAPVTSSQMPSDTSTGTTATAFDAATFDVASNPSDARESSALDASLATNSRSDTNSRPTAMANLPGAPDLTDSFGSSVPATPDFSASRIDAKVVSTPTGQDLTGTLEQMAYTDDFGIQGAFGATAPSQAALSPQTPANDSVPKISTTRTPAGVDWSQYLPR